MRVLVTGGAGFIGSHLVDRLLAEGHEVDVVDDLSTGSLANLAEARAGGGVVRFHQLDLRSADLPVLAARRRPEVVYHLAAPAAADPWLDPDGYASAAVGGSLQVVEAARRAGAAKVVVAASARIYGPVERRAQPVRESRPPAPAVPAGVAEVAVAGYLRLYRAHHGLEHTVAVLADVYGPRQRPGPRALAATWVRRVLGDQPCEMDGDGSAPLDLVYVDDAVDALARAATRGGGLQLHVGTGTATSQRDLWAAVTEAVPGPTPLLVAGPAAGDPTPVLDAGRAAIHLGWRPWTPLPEGVAATAAWAATAATGVSGTGPPRAS